MKIFLKKLFTNKLFFSLIVNFIIFVFCIEVSSVSYDSFNDYLNSVLISKYKIIYNSNINCILAYAISNLQYLFDDINLFAFSQLAFSYLAFVSITYALSDKFNFHNGIIFSVIVNILFSLNHYADISSIKTSAILMVGGFLLIFNSIRRKRFRFICIAGIIEIAIGSFYCYEYFFVAIAFAIVYFICDMFSKGKHKIRFRKFMWYFRPYLIIYIIITLLVISCNQYSVNINNSTKELQKNYDYYKISQKIEYSAYPDYEKNKSAFNSIGIYDDEYYLLKKGYYDETTVLNIDALKLVYRLQQKDNQKTFLTSANDLLFDTWQSLTIFDTDALLLLTILIVAIIYIYFHKKTQIFFPIFLFLTAIILNIIIRYLYNGYYYTLYGVWTFLFIFMLYSIDFNSLIDSLYKIIERKNKSLFFLSFVFTIVLFSIYSIVYQANLHNTYNTKNRPSTLMTEIGKHPERYYVFDPETAKEYVKNTNNYIHPLWGFKKNYLENIDSFGYMHHSKNIKKKYSTKNIYTAAITSDKIYVVDNSITYKKENYLTKYYTNENESPINYIFMQDINKYKIYQIL